MELDLRPDHSRVLAGAMIKVQSDANQGANLAKRIISEVELDLMVRAARTRRDRVRPESSSGLKLDPEVFLR
jgi:hypothetical protein